jgi:DNA-binding NarL/FixJ family response regulator
LAQIAQQRGSTQRAALLFGAAETCFESAGSFQAPGNRTEYASRLAALRAQLGDTAFMAAVQEGHRMSIPEAVAFALEAATATAIAAKIKSSPKKKDASHASKLPPQPPYPNGLSNRQVEVLQLIASGLTDSQVAAQLSLSTRTVESHARSILVKIGVSSRQEATRWAFDNGLM